jgi:hypothetical protein
VADLGDAAPDRVEHLERRHDLARRMHRNVELAGGERPDALGDPLGRQPGAAQALGSKKLLLR